VRSEHIYKSLQPLSQPSYIPLTKRKKY